MTNEGSDRVEKDDKTESAGGRENEHVPEEGGAGEEELEVGKKGSGSVREKSDDDGDGSSEGVGPDLQ